MRTASRLGVSLVEVLVAVSVVGVLVGLLLPAVQDVRRAAARADCQNRMRQLGLALHAHHDTRGRLPFAVDVYGDPSHYTVPGTGQQLAWPTTLLVYLDQSGLADATAAAVRQTADPFRNPPHMGLSTPVRAFACPADGRTPPAGRPAVIWYFGVSGTGDGVRIDRPPVRRPDVRGAFFGSVRFAQITDGLSNTLLLGERPPDPDFESGWWYIPNARSPLPDQPVLGVTTAVPATLDCGPNGTAESWFYPGEVDGVFVYGPGRPDNRCDAMHYWSLHGGGANWLLCDGSVRFLPYSARDQLKPLSTRANGDIASLD